MQIILQRRPSIGGATIGDLTVRSDDAGGFAFCYTIEDEIREQRGRPVSEWKIPGRTAIPAGTYNVVITFSQRFQRDLPLLLNVPGFEGVRIHPGNTAADTEGCILPGTAIAGDGRSVLNSRAAFNSLFEGIRRSIAASEAVNITIHNPTEVAQ